jgi:hypothetical protein
MRSEVSIFFVHPALEITMQIDIAKTGLENILLLANTTNSRTLTAAEVDISAVTTWVDPQGTNTRNTEVTFSAKAGSVTYKGSQVLRYTRNSLSAIEAILELGEFQSEVGSTIADVKAFAVAALGLAASDVEIVEAEMPTWDDGTVDGETAPLTLRAINGSYLYTGEITVTVVEPVDGRERMSTVYATQDLTGFDLPPGA